VPLRQVLQHAHRQLGGHVHSLRIGQIFGHGGRQLEQHLSQLSQRHVLCGHGRDEPGGVPGVPGEFEQLPWIQAVAGVRVQWRLERV